MGRDDSADIVKQHVIDPEICIRCNTCEETCPQNAVTHNDRNYVVDFDACKYCGACLLPCPTGAIDNWRLVPRARPYTLEEQFEWDSLPPQEDFGAAPDDGLPEEVERLTSEARAGQGGVAPAPWSAETPAVNLYTLKKPAIATVTGNYRLTDDNASGHIHHIILDFGTTPFPVLEGQSIGILPPGTDANGRPHHIRLYSVASPRDGEKPNHNNLSLTVKRVTEDHEGKPVRGVASNYLCDLKKGDQVTVVGPYGSTFLMPNHPGSSLMMICTGTGSAPMRAMTERRRRRIALKEGGQLMLFFGARRPGELPYFGPLMKLPRDFIDINLAFSREPDKPKTYVQDLIRARGADVARLLGDENCYIYVCGLKGMEEGVKQAFRDVCAQHGMDWDALQPELLAKGRFHVETY
ncbi:MAG TPA: benzoyl-CoA 2,3-epoxidase subunit BoxA [Burkholderiales bacterium]